MLYCCSLCETTIYCNKSEVIFTLATNFPVYKMYGKDLLWSPSGKGVVLRYEVFVFAAVFVSD